MNEKSCRHLSQKNTKARPQMKCHGVELVQCELRQKETSSEGRNTSLKGNKQVLAIKEKKSR
jgi:hypothetical protein